MWIALALVAIMIICGVVWFVTTPLIMKIICVAIFPGCQIVVGVHNAWRSGR